jgi:hypothetical protein
MLLLYLSVKYNHIFCKYYSNPKFVHVSTCWKSFTPAARESYTRTEVHPPLLTDQQPPEQETIRGNPKRSSDTSRRAQKPVLLYSFIWKILYITILRCVWKVRKLQEYYAVLHSYKYRKRKWSAADASEPNVCRMWNLSDIEILNSSLSHFLIYVFKISFISV